MCKSNKTISKYPDLADCPIIDFSDYLNVYKGDKSSISFPIEKSRGCHWNKCKFCFLNQGYKYRIKSPSILSQEIIYLIQEYGIFSYSFLDNDVVGQNLLDFDELLNSLISIKEQYPDFTIHLAEIISRNLSSDYIKKMHLAGFEHVQIGYESPSDNILHKISKKNTFASNLLFIKWASEYKIRVGGMNIIRGLLDETIEDILEGIKNVYFLRFYKTTRNYTHLISSLAISNMSRYYKELTDIDKNSGYYTDPIKEYLPPNHIAKEYEFCIFQQSRKFQDVNWNFFREVL